MCVISRFFHAQHNISDQVYTLEHVIEVCDLDKAQKKKKTKLTKEKANTVGSEYQYSNASMVPKCIVSIIYSVLYVFL